MLYTSFKKLYWREFDSIKQGAEYFHVKPRTIERWLSGAANINPMAEKLLVIKALGYLPNDVRWSGFRIDEERGIFITRDGREFSPKELDAFALWKDEYQRFIEKYGHLERAPIYPAHDNVLPFRGGRRAKAAQWIPSRDNFGKPKIRFKK
ncbi:phage protein [Vibrio viridaestus]|uniref:S-adenosylhomocysteine hydrolase n=1 Tax=Vibrio viridaestus TaxID=2487322 RepID=A0A3N9TAV7_9VIBR|nr:phage protein [Vibrio viridaestus]RQW61040.1 S-adenosylhomocysteine hydrolase [Vibrio viridaestus]